MKQFGILCVFISLASAGFGIYLIAVSAMRFVPERFSLYRIAIGIVLTVLGLPMLVTSVKLLSKRRKNNSSKRKNKNSR